jgi:hypothetical protein
VELLLERFVLGLHRGDGVSIAPAAAGGLSKGYRLGNFAGQVLQLFGQRGFQAFEVRILSGEHVLRATAALAVRTFQRQSVFRSSAEASFFHGCHFDVVPTATVRFHPPCGALTTRCRSTSEGPRHR